MQYAPIALFTYNRPAKTKRVLESLMLNAEAKDSDLFIFSDGPKNEKAVEGVRANREYLQSFKDALPSREGWGGAVSIIEREKNWGLANSLIAGITDLCEKYGKVIVVEDDLILSPFFLKFMNDGLNKYENDDRVASISGFLNPVDADVPNTFFLRYFACWGWATWKRSWNLLINDSRELLRQLRWKKNDFNVGGTGPFYGILYCDKVGLNNSWAVRFYASQFLSGKLQLFPGKTLVIQNGTDGSGTHCIEKDTTYDGMCLFNDPLVIGDIPVEESKYMYQVYSEFYNHGRKKTIKSEYERFKSFIRRLLNIDCR